MPGLMDADRRRDNSDFGAVPGLLSTGEHLAYVAGGRDCHRVGAAWARVVVRRRPRLRPQTHLPPGRLTVRLQCNDATLDADDRRVRAIIGVQLGQDILYAAFDRFLSNAQAGGDFLIGVTFRD